MSKGEHITDEKHGIMLSEEEIFQRFNKISTFALESQKQCMDSMKFSLNAWIIINSGAAIALIGKEPEMYHASIIAFMAGAIFAAIGNILLCGFSYDLFSTSKHFILSRSGYSSYISKHFSHYTKAQMFILVTLFASYLSSVIAVFNFYKIFNP